MKEVGTARESASTHKGTRSIKVRTEKWTGMPVRATKKFFVFMYVVPMAIRIALELARKGGVQGGDVRDDRRKTREDERERERDGGKKKRMRERQYEDPQAWQAEIFDAQRSDRGRRVRNRRGKGRPESRGHKLSYVVTCAFSSRSRGKMVAIFS